MQNDVAGEFFAAARTATEQQMARAIPILRGAEPPSPTASGPLLLSMGDAARLAGISRCTLWRCIGDGRIKPIEVRAGFFRVRRRDILALAGEGDAS